MYGYGKKITCLSCDEVFEGRSDRKFCSDYCKSNYHYLLNKQKEHSLFTQVAKQLKLNRRLLRDFNKAGKSTMQGGKLTSYSLFSNYSHLFFKICGVEIRLIHLNISRCCKEKFRVFLI